MKMNVSDSKVQRFALPSNERLIETRWCKQTKVKWQSRTKANCLDKTVDCCRQKVTNLPVTRAQRVCLPVETAARFPPMTPNHSRLHLPGTVTHSQPHQALVISNALTCSALSAPSPLRTLLLMSSFF